MDESKPDEEGLLESLRANWEKNRQAAFYKSLRDARIAALEYQYGVYVLIYVATHGPRIMAWSPETLKRLEKDEGKDESWKGFLRDAAAVANAEKEGGFPQLYALGAVAIWTGLEDAVNTLLELYLGHDPAKALSSPKLKDLKVSLVEYLSLQQDERPSFILSSLKNKVGAALKDGLGVFESTLDVLGLKCEVDVETRAVLHELHKIRNCVVHRRGITDQKLARECPSLMLRVGEPIKINAERFSEYFAAGNTYIRTLYAHVLGEGAQEGGLAVALRAASDAKEEAREAESQRSAVRKEGTEAESK